jgi:regulation of enolase protein 1 (concanavalin A-like superfamily)
MVNAEVSAELHRRQVQRIVASTEFASSRQLREYFKFLAEAAFDGRTQLDQTEIAEGVLHRGKDFNPVDDASVRKLATLLRHKLTAYYATEGAGDEVVVTLPTRSYIPLFHAREISSSPLPEAKSAFPPAEVAAPAPRSSRILYAVIAIVIVGLVSQAVYFLPASAMEPQFNFATASGDIMHRENSLPADGLRLGPEVGPYDQVTVRMAFSPERATQQAGILLYADADHYVKLGRQFNSRAQLEFGVEVAGHYQKPSGTFSYDPMGQSNAPVWLSIRRYQSKFTAMTSSDGLEWKRFGNELEMPGSRPIRVGLYAHNGRSDAPSTKAVFDRLTVGAEFHGYDPGVSFTESSSGWRTVRSLESPLPIWETNSLLLPFSAREKVYSTSFLRPARSGDWTISTRLDFLSMHGAAAGLTVRGDRSNFRLIRWDLDGGSITAEHLGYKQANLKDFGGEPPLILRVRCRNGLLTSSFSRDGAVFQEFPLRVPLAELGSKIEYGVEGSKSTWGGPQEYPPARFFYFHQEVETLQNHK